MAMTLIEQAKTEQNELKRGVIELFAKKTPIFELMPFMTIEGNAYEYNQEKALPGIAFRGVNEAYSESVGILNPLVEKLKIMGDIDAIVAECADMIAEHDLDLDALRGHLEAEIIHANPFAGVFSRG